MTAYEAKQIAYNSVEGDAKDLFDRVMYEIEKRAKEGHMSFKYEFTYRLNQEQFLLERQLTEFLLGKGFAVFDFDGYTITWYHAQPDKI